MALVYDDVIASHGFVSQRAAGLHVVALDAIVGTVNRRGEFDRRFRPVSRRTQSRWQSIATMMRRGDPLPAVALLRIGETYFVEDGHNRVSVARALGRDDIDAQITEVRTRSKPEGSRPVSRRSRVLTAAVSIGARRHARCAERTARCPQHCSERHDLS
jgi:hypothetical protein